MMTEKEAIERIKNDLEWHSKELKPAYKEALRMAIEALDKQVAMKEVISCPDDLIRRKSVLEMITDEKTFVDREAYHSLRNLEEYVCGLPAICNIENNGWFAVSDRFPKDRELVLATDKDGRVQVCKFFAEDNEFRLSWDMWKYDAIAWQPLPGQYEPK